MTVAIIYAVVAAALFGAVFVTKRRFGLLGLALATGSLLSTMWDYDAGLIVAGTGLVPAGPLTNAITLAVIVLAPAIVLLFHGYTYKSMPGRVFGAALFTLLALAFLIQPLSSALVLEGTGVDVYNWLMERREAIISLGLVIAVIDLFLTKPAGLIDKDKKK